MECAILQGERTMNAIHTTATLGIDGMLHVPIPGAKPGVEYNVTVRPKPVSSSLLAGEVLKDSMGVLDEETEFERPPQGILKPVEPLDLD
jgi:hypothetical protein